MRIFDYVSYPNSLLKPEIVSLLSAIHEFRGKQDLYMTAKKDVLNALLDVARIQSTDASNRIEGIFTSNERLRALVKEKAVPMNRNEREIAGYRDVLATIHDSYEAISISPNTILQLHKNLYAFQSTAIGEQWKDCDNVIAEIDADGIRRVRFHPVPAVATPGAMHDLCEAYNRAFNSTEHDPLLLSMLFIFDFLCIHPFNDGNGRMSRLLTLLLLYRQRYIVGKYISLEMLIEKSKETYYESLLASSSGWDKNENDVTPFLQYMLGIILKAYREFADRVENIITTKLNKSDRIRQLFESHLGTLSKSQIAEKCPDISIAMIEKTLRDLLKKGTIQKKGGSKNTVYFKN